MKFGCEFLSLASPDSKRSMLALNRQPANGCFAMPSNVAKVILLTGCFYASKLERRERLKQSNARIHFELIGSPEFDQFKFSVTLSL